MTLLDYMQANPGITVVLAIIAGLTVCSVFSSICSIGRRGGDDE